jgi:dTDP-D-glucose 4,6-dehydratase
MRILVTGGAWSIGSAVCRLLVGEMGIAVWRARESFASGLRKTVAWYLENRWWWEHIWSGRYRGTRLGGVATAAAD